MVKQLPRIITAIIGLVLLAVSAGLGWLSLAPRDVSAFVPRLQRALEDTGAPIRFSLKQARIDWRRAASIGRISLNGLSVTTTNGAQVAHVPRADIRLDPISLAFGKLRISWLIIPRSELVLTATEDRSFRLGFAADTSHSLPLSALLPANKEGSSASFLPIDHVLIEDAVVAIRDTAGALLLRSYNSELAVNAKDKGAEAAIRLNFRYNKQAGSLNALIQVQPKADELSLAASMVNLPMGLICGLAGECGMAQGLRGAITGTASARRVGRTWHQAEALLRGDRMRFQAPEWFAEPLSFHTASVHMGLDEQGNRIRLHAAELRNSEVTLQASATATKAKAGWNVEALATQRGLALKQLHRYWPLPLAPETRTWVIQSITSGTSPQASVRIALNAQEQKMDVLPDHFLHSTIDVTGATVRYLPGLAPIRDVAGKVIFTGQTMQADIGQGRFMRDSQLPKASIICPDLNHPNVPMRTALQFNANAADAALLLQHPAFRFDDSLLLAPKHITGRAHGVLNLSFDAFNGAAATAASDFDLSDVSYDADITLENISQRGLLGAYHVDAFSGQLRGDDNGVSLTGKGQMNGQHLALTLHDRSGDDTLVTLEAGLKAQDMEALGLPKRPELGEGVATIEASLRLAKDTATLDSLRSDFKDMALNIPAISWHKPRGVASQLKLKALANNRLQLTHAGADLEARGELMLSPASMQIQSLVIDTLRTPRNDFSLRYAPEAQGFSVVLTGKRLDHSASYMMPANPAGENALLANFPSIDLTLDLAELVLNPAMPLKGLKGRLDCRAKRCSFANMQAQVGDKPLDVAINQGSNGRTFTLTSGDAGALLKAIDATDKVFGGDLRFAGTYEGAVLNGKLFITDFNVKKSDLLARLFSVASLSGMANLLTGSGIDFSKLRANVRHDAGIFTLTEARTSGNSVGYTTKGTVNTRDASLNLKGVLVPAYMLNSIVGKIPLIGALAGGEGEGLISFNYRIKGAYADPQVSVNPLSGLAPGFLRGIFDGEDTVPASTAPLPKPEAPQTHHAPAITTIDDKTPKGAATPHRERR